MNWTYLLFSIGILSVAALGQEATNLNDYSRNDQANYELSRVAIEIRMPSARTGPEGFEWVSQGSFIRNTKIEQSLSLTKAQKQNFAQLLKQKGVGLFMLIPENLCREMWLRGNRIYTCPQSAFYWFKSKQHLSLFADLRLSDGSFETGIGRNSFGKIVSIGDVKLEEVDFSNPQALRLSELSFPKTIDLLNAARTDSHRSAPLKLNETYILRSAIKGWSDVLIAFRVVEIEPGGAVLMAWKRLDKKK